MKLRAIFIVDSGNKSSANKAFASAGLGDDTFNGAGYGESDTGKAKFFVCSLVEEEEVFNSLKETGLFEKVQVTKTDDFDVNDILSEMGIVPIIPKRMRGK